MCRFGYFSITVFLYVFLLVLCFLYSSISFSVMWAFVQSSYPPAFLSYWLHSEAAPVAREPLSLLDGAETPRGVFTASTPCRRKNACVGRGPPLLVSRQWLAWKRQAWQTLARIHEYVVRKYPGKVWLCGRMLRFVVCFDLPVRCACAAVDVRRCLQGVHLSLLVAPVLSLLKESRTWNSCTFSFVFVAQPTFICPCVFPVRFNFLWKGGKKKRLVWCLPLTVTSLF